MTVPATALPPGEPTDAELVEKARGGDAPAFSMLFARHQRRLYQLAWGIVKRREEALDVVQDAFLRMHRGLEGFKGEAAFASWAWRITRNLALDALRRRREDTDELDERIHAADHDDAPGSLGDANDPNPARATLRGELAGQLRAAMATLSEQHRTILVLREVEGLSYEELAEQLDIPIGTVMSRLFHARRKMQAALRPYLDDDAS